MDLRNYKLLVTDVDGTALDPNHELQSETVEAFRALRNFGMFTTIATGKIYPAVDYLIAPLCGELPFLVAHGSIVQDQKGNVLMQHGVPPQVMEIVRRTSEKHIVIFVFTWLMESLLESSTTICDI